MPFGLVNVVGLGMGVLDGVVIVEWEGAVLRVNLRQFLCIGCSFLFAVAINHHVHVCECDTVLLTQFPVTKTRL